MASEVFSIFARPHRLEHRVLRCVLDDVSLNSFNAKDVDNVQLSWALIAQLTFVSRFKCVSEG